MWLLYAQWRYRGVDPYRYVHGEFSRPTDGRYEAMMAGFAVYAARVDEAMLGLGG